MPSNQYITSQQFDVVLQSLNYQASTTQQQEILDRATGDLEADLAEKFVVPLEYKGGGAFTACPAFAKMKVLNALKAKVRQIIGYDQNRNLVIESTERFVDTHGRDYKDQIKVLLESKIDFKFRLLSQAEEAREAVQFLGLARSNNTTDPNEEDGIDP